MNADLEKVTAKLEALIGISIKAPILLASNLYAEMASDNLPPKVFAVVGSYLIATTAKFEGWDDTKILAVVKAQIELLNVLDKIQAEELVKERPSRTTLH